MAGYEYLTACFPLQSIASLRNTIPTHALHVHMLVADGCTSLIPRPFNEWPGYKTKVANLTSLVSRLVCGHENLGAH